MPLTGHPFSGQQRNRQGNRGICTPPDKHGFHRLLEAQMQGAGNLRNTLREISFLLKRRQFGYCFFSCFLTRSLIFLWCIKPSVLVEFFLVRILTIIEALVFYVTVFLNICRFFSIPFICFEKERSILRKAGNSQPNNCRRSPPPKFALTRWR